MKYLTALAAFAALSLCSTAYAQDVSVSASVSVSVDPSSTLSSVSSELSSAVSSVSSELSSELSSMSSSSGEALTCDDLDTATLNVTALAEPDLSAITSVTVFAVDECSGLADLAAMDAGAIATLTTNTMVQAALTAQGEFGGEIIAYTLTDGSLTVYVRDRD